MKEFKFCYKTDRKRKESEKEKKSNECRNVFIN